jgi:hypothetical protein
MIQSYLICSITVIGFCICVILSISKNSQVPCFPFNIPITINNNFFYTNIFFYKKASSLPYLRHISGTSPEHLMHISATSQTHLSHISATSQPHPSHILTSVMFKPQQHFNVLNAENLNKFYPLRSLSPHRSVIFFF